MNRFKSSPNLQKTELPLEPSFWATWLILLLILLFVWLFPVPDEWRLMKLSLGLAGILYVFVMFRVLGRYGSHSPSILLLRQIANLAFLALGQFFFSPLGLYLDPIYLLPIASVGIASGRFAALTVATLATLLIVVRDQVLFPRGLLDAPSSWFLIAACYVSAMMISELRTQMLKRLREQQSEIGTLQKETARRAEQMTVFLQLGQEMSRSLNVQAVCQAIGNGVSRLMPNDAFFVVLREEVRKRNRFFIKMGPNQAFYQRAVSTNTDIASYVIRSREILCLDPAMEDPRFDTRSLGVSAQARALLIAPLVVEDKVIGALATQSFQPNAYGANEIETFKLLVSQAATALQNARYYTMARDIAGQLASLNRIAQIVTSTLEFERVMELIGDEVSRILFADSYFIATVNLARGEMQFEFLLDEGRRYPSETISLGPNLPGYVAIHRAPLLLDNAPEQMSALGLEPLALGSQKRVQSWLGVPLLSGEELIGVLAVSSYAPEHFDKSDLDLLQSIAQQAAIAVVNARIHAEVQEQSRRDSLTQVYNHGYFVTRLTEEIERARNESKPLSVIMLDVDFFKRYNDTYGHRVGDQVLKTAVNAIRTHIKRTDIIGRWGGEEFGIILLKATTAQAEMVAERIRVTLRQTPMYDEDNHLIPTPTVSQGIANLPNHANDSDRIVVLADRALYAAKQNGRDRIQVAEENSA